MKIIEQTISIRKFDHETGKASVGTPKELEDMPISIAVDRIFKLNDGLNKFWSSSTGWAPLSAAALLSKSRLDWQVQLSRTLGIWLSESPTEELDARLILGWANLGSLLEGSMKLFLAVWYDDYKKDVDAIKKKGKFQDPDGLQLEALRQFFRKRIWDSEFDALAANIQKRRNAIHSFKDKDIGTRADFFSAIKDYLIILRYINFRLPYPDDLYVPREV